MKWAFLCGAVFALAVLVSVLRNALGAPDSLWVSVISGGVIGLVTVVLGRRMGLFPKRTDNDD
ncbi:hypothetical protein [Thalassobium sp. R2A62]|jgi:hypothetical protein|uniref:hypothetical protein n=1 Tax=Thalassobium sp. R2A62 TaxID=633131 RepID=UPI0001B1CEF6|nr:hypothetical protein [Thalassobium sp. R2A62]EET47889.1 hypothetical protein TR2A62_2054 [Thalassobium sp. R2A62]MDG1340493.1 hypothetical protein [Paracoccaceae bacterium]MDG1802082.1 hypothetical protein [Paracoccaceae bacterium]MDG2452019.1 hypothetical protein [Paracoccaceae bacterium]